MDPLVLDAFAVSSTGFLAAVVLKATLVLAGAALVARLFARRSAALRHGVWTLAVGAILALPLFQAVAPPLAAPLPLPRTRAAHVPATTSGTVERVTPLEHRSEPPTPVADAARPAGNPEANRMTFPVSWPMVAFLSWLFGALIVAAYFIAGRISLARISSGARPIDDASWLRSAREIAERLAVRPTPRLLVSDAAIGPMTWGMRHATVLLPAHAEDWADGRRRSFLLHEFAHVARRDCAIQDLAHIACALYWFHPAVWYAAHRLRVEREPACDDIVLVHGESAENYAQNLLDVVRATRTPSGALSVSGAAMATRSQLETRIRALLDANVDRSRLGRRRAVAGTALALALALPLAALAPAARSESKPATVASKPAPPVEEVVALTTAPAGVLGGTMQGRWQHAVDEGRKLAHGEGFWVSYAIPFKGRVGREDRPEPETLLSDSEGWNPDDLEDQGPSLAERFDYAQDDAVFLLRVGTDASSASPKFERVAIRSARLSPKLDGKKIVSMGRVGIEESFDWLAARLDQSPEDRRATVLVSAISLHESPRTEPLLEKILGGSRAEAVRAQAAEGLARHPGEPALKALVAHTRTDVSEQVRREAAESIGELEYAPATDALISLCREIDDVHVRAEAVESLGDREPEKVVPVLVDISDRDPSETVRREAVETLGDLPGNAGLEPLQRMATHSTDPAVRSEAVETLNDLALRAEKVKNHVQ